MAVLDVPGAPGEEVAVRLAAWLQAIRTRRPLIHHLANLVTMQAVASVTRALGALPVMALAGEDAREMAGEADALVISLGTPTPQRLEAIGVASEVASARGIPIVLDPVGAGATRGRTDAARRLLARGAVWVVRANYGEAAALAGQGGLVRGVEAIDPAAGGDAVAVATALARAGRCVAAMTGACDVVADGNRYVLVENGHPWLQAIPGAGCMATAVVGIFCAVASIGDGGGQRTRHAVLEATAAGLACFGLAAQIARGHARGPGTLGPALLDALFHLTPEQARQGARVRAGGAGGAPARGGG